MMAKELPPLTEFQKEILCVLEKRPERRASIWVIAQIAFADKWKKLASRGALVGNIRKAANKMPDFCFVCPPEGEHGDFVIGLRSSV
jgi:hypothetical protein